MKQFREFFRLNQDLFFLILTLVKSKTDLTKIPYYRVSKPISPEEKLAIKCY
jgi:hypothetical protein